MSITNTTNISNINESCLVLFMTIKLHVTSKRKKCHPSSPYTHLMNPHDSRTDGVLAGMFAISALV